MAVDFGFLLPLLDSLPTLLQAAQMLSYLMLVFFFGHIALKGWRGHHKFYIAFPAKAGLGFASLLVGASIAAYLRVFPLFSNQILRLFQIDVFIGGMISALALSVGLTLVSYRTPVLKIASIGTAIPMLDDRVSRLEQTLFRQGILKPGVKENEAKEIAEKSLAGYNAASADLDNGFWEVSMKKGKKEALVVVDAYSTKVKDVVLKGIDPLKMAGICVIAALVIIGIVLFQGFPDVGKDFFSLLGSPGGDSGISTLIGGRVVGDGSQNPECVGIETLLLAYGPDIVGNSIPPLEDQQVKDMIEEKSGSAVSAMFSVSHEGKDMIIALVDSGACASTMTSFCECIVIE